MNRTTIIIIAALVCVGVAIGVILALSGDAGPAPIKPEGTTIDDLISVQKNPPPDYIDELTGIIEESEDQQIRDAAINVLTDIAIRRSETDKIIDFLKDLAAHEEDPVIMSAAYAGIDLIRDSYPLPPMGSLNLSVRGEVKRGGEVEIVATIASTTDIPKAVLGLDFPPDSVEMLDPPVYYTTLSAKQPVTHTFPIRLLQTGEVKIPVQLTLSTDLTDYEQIDRSILFVVREGNGEYSIL
ncbi:MAG: hypothetical protein LUQ33_00330 [Methanoregulaceae archaeon]|nr:hypothetical protein [Methanoregulaceae archaeon]